MTKAIEEIIALEWEMFQRVNEGGPRADCQDEYGTFYDMRFGQFAEWSENARNSYLDDLRSAKSAERNLVQEKYIWMMIESAPETFLELSSHVTLPTERAKELADSVCEILMAQTEWLHERYPSVAGSGRPLYTSDESAGLVSIETYQYSELLTYSENTHQALYEHITKLSASDIMLAELIMTNSVKHYGYSTLSDAEAALGGGSENA
ncbi:MAG: DUF4125 family protein [Clostridiales bacterium]|nr:DUF4125 family protein [Clostridiales bacterium]